MPRFLKQFGFLALIVCAGLAALAATIRQPGFDPDSNCVGNARLIALAVQAYTQDYDEILPPMSHTQEFATALTPYARGVSNLFDCPATGLPYQPNGKLSGQHLSEYPNPDNVQIFRDSVPHPDGQVTMAYLSGRVDPSPQATIDVNAVCVDRARQVNLSLLQYTQDYDEHYPLMTSQPTFEADLLPYTKSSQVFICPATGYKYVPNAAISEEALSQIAYPADIETFIDHKPHADGIETVGYADGHVTHGDQNTYGSQGSAGCLSNLSSLGFALQEYLQDYDEMYPPTTTFGEYRTVTYPYIKNSAVFACPVTGLHYNVNPALSGLSHNAVPNPSTVSAIYDQTYHADGTYDTAYADGHVGSQRVWTGQTLTVGTDHKPALAVTGQTQSGSWAAIVWDLSSLGGPATTFNYSPPYSGLSSQLSIGEVSTIHADQRLFELNYLPQTNGANALTPGNGLIDVWFTSPAGDLLSNTLSGPYDGWSVVAQSSGGTGQSHLLWQRYDGQLALWTLTSKGGYASDVRLTPPAGETVDNLVTGADGTSYLLLSQSDGVADLWTVGSNGNIESEQTYNDGSGAASVAVAVTPSNLPVLLFSDGDGDAGSGQAEAWALDAGGGVTKDTPVYLDSGWTTSQIVVGPDGDYWILWKKPGVETAVTRFTSSGVRVFKRAYSLFQ